MNDEQAKEILKARARMLARPADEKRDNGGALEVVEFRLAQEHYAVELKDVREVHPLKELTVLPGTPSFFLGVINVRGQILPVIDIKKFFELPDVGITDMHSVIIVKAEDIELGILADVITGASSIPLNTIQPSLPTLTGIRAQYLKGVTDQQVVILDASRILADPTIIINQEMAS